MRCRRVASYLFYIYKMRMFPGSRNISIALRPNAIYTKYCIAGLHAELDGVGLSLHKFVQNDAPARQGEPQGVGSLG